MLYLLFAIATAQYTLKPQDGGYWSYTYSSGADAELACADAGMSVCYLNQLIGAAQNGYYACSAGWYNTPNGYQRGFYVDPENAADVAACGNSGLTQWGPESGLGTAHCCMPTYFNPGYNSGSVYDLAEAEAYCAGTDYPSVCTVRQVKEISIGGEDPNQNSVSSIYADGSVGWYDGAQQRWDGLTGWPASRGYHCCSDYAAFKTVPSYAVLPESQDYTNGFWSGAEANAACLDEGYAGLCTVGQQAQAELDGNGVCFVGWVYKDTLGGALYNPGYYGNCGAADTWNDDYRPDTPGAHCCTAEQASADIAFPVYQTKKYAYAYLQAEAQAQCQAIGSEYSLCSRGQLLKVATESFTYNGYDHTAITDMCNLGWTQESDGSGELTWYQVDATDGCGNAGDWNTLVGAQYGTYHCCQDFPADAVATPIYESLKWAYFSAEDAAAQCRAGASLCTRDQLAKVATESFDYNGLSHTAITDMCSQGWTADAGLGWWQVEDTPGCAPIGLNQMNAFSATTGTYHCCLPFPADSSTAVFETRQWFYYTQDEAADMCGTGASQCTSEQVYRAAIESFTYDGKSHTAVTNLCSQGWTSDLGLGWWQVDAGCGTPNEWNTFTATTGTYFCCLPFEGLPLPTTTTTTEAGATVTTTTAAATTTTETETTTTKTPSMVPTAPVATTSSVVVNNMPSSETESPPAGCEYYNFAPTGFEGEVSYCVYDGMVYLGGYSTCIPEATDALDVALQNSWDNDWYFGANQDCTARDYDLTVEDQLWVTNKMCDNLEEDIAEIEVTTAGYLDNWTQSVVDLINANMDNFDEATQQALTDYLATLT